MAGSLVAELVIVALFASTVGLRQTTIPRTRLLADRHPDNALTRVLPEPSGREFVTGLAPIGL